MAARSLPAELLQQILELAYGTLTGKTDYGIQMRIRALWGMS